jgi:hypothetical protein
MGTLMAIVNLEDGRIADEFEIGQEPNVLRDALVMTSEEYNLLTPDEIAAMKQARYDNWLAVISTLPQE